jgi:hypothetical protein
VPKVSQWSAGAVNGALPRNRDLSDGLQGTLVLLLGAPAEIVLSERRIRANHEEIIAFVNLKLTRFRGHPNICVQGVHDGEDETTLHTGIPSSDGRAGPRRPLARGTSAQPRKSVAARQLTECQSASHRCGQPKAGRSTGLAGRCAYVGWKSLTGKIPSRPSSGAPLTRRRPTN